MFASSSGPRSVARRRGIVLVLVLGMLGLMALIGVTFATFAGQSLKNARNFGQGVGRPQPEALMDYALAQLINDTNNPFSAIRGHSLLRDMYGNDSVYRGANPPANAAVETGGLFSAVNTSTGYSTLHFTAILPTPNGLHSTSVHDTPFYGQVQYVTNIPTTGDYGALDFTRWILTFPGFTTPNSPYSSPPVISYPAAYAPQTFEVLEDDASNSLVNGVHVFTLSANLGAPTTLDTSYTTDFLNNNSPTTGGSVPVYSSSDYTAFLYNDPNVGASYGAGYVTKNYTHLLGEFSTLNNSNAAGKLGVNGTTTAISNPFVLDGRYMRAFNGPGLTRPSTAVSNGTSVVFNPAYPFNRAAYGNMRIIGSDPAVQLANTNPTQYPYTSLYGVGNPDAMGMDEDYDACDLENWFLAIQSADGQVMIPSFHRPGILSASEWTLPVYDSNNNVINAAFRSKILRPRQIDNSPLFPYDPSVVDPTTGKLTYDVDNDGDGVTDSVWLDLGYPTQRDPNGKIYKPLFAFMVLGLNGRLPLNTVGNVQDRAMGVSAATSGYTDPLTYQYSTGQVPYPGSYVYNSGTAPNHHPLLTSQVFNDTPVYDHASHLGFSVSEINPKFALQNAPSNMYASSNGTYPASANGGYADYTSLVSYSQLDDAGVSVALTQLRNLLSGTKPTDVPNPYSGALPINSSFSSSTYLNQDVNIVYVNGQPNIMPNGVADGSDVSVNGGVTRAVPAVAGRWGEPEIVPTILTYPITTDFDPSYPILHWSNPVRAGRSYYYNVSLGATSSTDAMDDDSDAFDPYLPYQINYPTQNLAGGSVSTPAPATELATTIPLNQTAGYGGQAFSRIYPEDVDAVDSIGQASVASERIRRYVTPQDPVGVGRMVNLNTRPQYDFDYGNGGDKLGRVGFFRYFRPAGMPQEIRYPYLDSGVTGTTTGTPVASTTDFSYSPFRPNSGNGQRYLMPVFLPAGQSTAGTASDGTSGRSIIPDVTSNLLHGYQAMATAEVTGTTAQAVAMMGGMPYNWDQRNNSNLGSTPGGYLTAIALYSPTIDPTNASFFGVNSQTGPNLGLIGAGTTTPPYNIPYVPNNGTYDPTSGIPSSPMVVNGYLGGSLNRDEADEMNLYSPSSSDLPFGATDLEWLYRKHDVDGATLNSRLSQLAPISFGNPADSLTRRRLFSTDSWELNSFVYANDNPVPYAGVLGGVGAHSSDHDFTYNSRFMANASPSLEVMNQVVSTVTTLPQYYQFGNPYTTEFLPNVTLPGAVVKGSVASDPNNYIPNSSYSASTALQLPQLITPSGSNVFSNSFTNAYVDQYTNVIVPYGGQSNNIPTSSVQVQTPSVSHRDRKINLNAPLPVSNDPGEPIRQKWCRETYRMLKNILPPASVDTPEELAALSQFVVNIIDFRDPDCSMTRFVNTDLIVTDVLTKSLPNTQTADVTNNTLSAWNVSPSGVRFATTNAADAIPSGHFPYDPSIYSPDDVTPFLVQHGMENNPIVINEAMAYMSRANFTVDSTTITAYQGMFFELVNTLTESQNNNNSTANSSAVSLSGWDILLAPDAYGWGRPDPITGDLNPIIYPPYKPTVGGNVTKYPDTTQQPNNGTSDTTIKAIQTAVEQYTFRSDVNPIVKAINNNAYQKFILGDYRTSDGNTSLANPAPITGTGATQTTVATPAGQNTVNIEGNSPVAKATEIDIHLPLEFSNPVGTTSTAAGKANYYWVYLRRPANPFDIALPGQVLPNQARPNREMVVVDSMRFPVIDCGDATVTPGTAGPPTVKPKVTKQAPYTIFSSQRLQPNRGGHLIRTNTTATTAPSSGSVASGVTTICPPSPPYAYGYSEQMAEHTTAAKVGPGAPSDATLPAGMFSYTSVTTSGTTNTSFVANLPITDTIYQTINNDTDQADTNWTHLSFLDRDFTSVAELLLVPGCPPGLFTKQFVEEQYPGNIFDKSNYTATGTDDSDLKAVSPATTKSQLKKSDNPSYVGRKDFNAPTMTSPAPTFPYLTDNFYYTAASVAPPSTPDSSQTYLTTEIGGWTGTGWHKMLEFFDVPSSANGAIGTADSGVNYDWYRADLKPGLLNLNLIIDEEVFAGLLDDPRLNEQLATYHSVLPYISGGTGPAGPAVIPYVVSQIDVNGYPSYDTSSGVIHGRYPMFPDTSVSVNILYNPSTLVIENNVGARGRGYVERDPNGANYVNFPNGPYGYQQIHGMKAAFSDFLKLRHGGSGYLFAHGAGDVGMGDFTVSPLSIPAVTQPIASDRPYRSLSYPDINYTIMRPATLPPAPYDTSHTYTSPGTYPPLPNGLAHTPVITSPATAATSDGYGYGAAVYGTNEFPSTGVSPYVELLAGLTATDLPSSSTSPQAPMDHATPYQYTQDPGIRNPFLAVQYANIKAPLDQSNVMPPPAVTPPAGTYRRLAPPYEATVGPALSPPLPIAAPFPAPIPPTPARRLFQIPDSSSASNANETGGYDNTKTLGSFFPVNEPVSTPTLHTGIFQPSTPPVSPTTLATPLAPRPPTLVAPARAVFMPDNYTPQLNTATNNYLGAGVTGAGVTNDLRQHPVFRTEWLQKLTNMSTVRTHQFATWITVGFFEVVKSGTPELGIPDILGQEVGAGAGNSLRYRSFFVLDRTKATGFNPYYPGNFRDCVTYRRRIE